MIYDPNLTVELPVAMSVTSGLNAIAHAVEAVYAQNRNPVSSMMAIEGVRALRDALRVIVTHPGERNLLRLFGLDLSRILIVAPRCARRCVIGYRRGVPKHAANFSVKR